MKATQTLHVWVENDYDPNKFNVFINTPNRQSSIIIRQSENNLIITPYDTILDDGQNPITWKGKPVSMTETENLKAWKAAADLQAENLKKITQFLDNHLTAISQ